MRIDSGNIGMESARLFKSSRSMRSGISADVSGNMTGSQLTSSFNEFMTHGETAKEQDAILEENTSDKIEKFSPFDLAQSMLTPSKKLTFSNVAIRTDATERFQKLHEEFIKNLMELFFGKHSRKKNCEQQSTKQQITSQNYTVVSTTEYISLSYEESETTTFQASGAIKTQDGREFNINLNLTMSSRFISNYSESYSTKSLQLTDPLVINLDDVPAGLTDISYFFDLDADGEKEMISMPAGGSGFLALDKNSDGVINDGSELFGTKSGDGFADLSAYDEDNSGWIDENDSIFNNLKIWMKDNLGNDMLYSLKDKNVGAICLSSADTDFTLNNNSHEMMGAVRKTGVFLYETGEVGTIQHIDLVS